MPPPDSCEKKKAGGQTIVPEGGEINSTTSVSLSDLEGVEKTHHCMMGQKAGNFFKESVYLEKKNCP